MSGKKSDLPKISKSRITLHSGGNTSDLNLSEEELKAYNARMGSVSAINQETAKEQTVSKVKYDEDVKNLNEKIEKKDEKIKELGKDKKNLIGERDSYKKQIDKIKPELESEKNKVQSLNTENRNLKDELAKYKKSSADSADAESKTVKELKEKIKGLESERNGLKTDVDSLKNSLGEKDGEIQRLRSDYGNKISELESELKKLTEENESLRQHPAATAEEVLFQDSKTMKRISGTELYSDMFEDGKYDVKIARSGSHILFVPNIEGSAECVNNTIKLPRLPELLPFKTACEYKIESAGNNVLKAELR